MSERKRVRARPALRLIEPKQYFLNHRTATEVTRFGLPNGRDLRFIEIKDVRLPFRSAELRYPVLC